MAQHQKPLEIGFSDLPDILEGEREPFPGAHPVWKSATAAAGNVIVAGRPAIEAGQRLHDKAAREAHLDRRSLAIGIGGRIHVRLPSG
jgi:hypothetical protein